jgi:hypothetical protein
VALEDISTWMAQELAPALAGCIQRPPVGLGIQRRSWEVEDLRSKRLRGKREDTATNQPKASGRSAKARSVLGPRSTEEERTSSMAMEKKSMINASCCRGRGEQHHAP